MKKEDIQRTQEQVRREAGIAKKQYEILRNCERRRRNRKRFAVVRNTKTKGIDSEKQETIQKNNDETRCGNNKNK